MAVVIIVQARMGSSGLAGKVLKQVLDRPLLAYLLDRLRCVQHADSIVVATTIKPQDQAIVDFCEAHDVLYFRGSEDDVLSRYYGAAKQHHAHLIVRITADCPLIDPAIIDQAIQLYRYSCPLFDYLSNCLVRTYPRGMDVEIFSIHSLALAAAQAKDAAAREHVTPFIYQNLDRFHCGNFFYTTDQSHLRLTVDTPQDFELIKKILENIYPKCPTFTLEDILTLLHKNPNWTTINGNVQRAFSTT